MKKKKYKLEVTKEELEMLHDNVLIGFQFKREILLEKINKLLDGKQTK